MINKKEYRFIISGGGSGGHIYPALSIADGLKNKFINSELLFVGSKNKMEMKIIPERGYKIKGLNILGFKIKVDRIENIFEAKFNKLNLIDIEFKYNKVFSKLSSLLFI